MTDTVSRPPIDPENMRALAVRMSRESATARGELRRFVAGLATWRDALPAFRAQVTTLLYPSGPAVQITKALRTDLTQWVADHGAARAPRSGTVTSKSVPVRWNSLELDDLDEAAKLAKLDRSTYIRQATNLAVKRDLEAAGLLVTAEQDIE